MEKVYYEVLEFEWGLLKNIYYYAFRDILTSKRNAELFYRIKVRQAQVNNTQLSFKLVLTILEDYQPTRHIISENESIVHELESMLLSAMTGKQIEIPEWPQRKAELLEEYA